MQMMPERGTSCYTFRINPLQGQSLVKVMRKRSLSILLVVVALLFSVWGNLIAAAFCPRYLNRVCCLTQRIRHPEHVDHQASCHHEMAGMTMDDMEMGRPEEWSDAQADAIPTNKSPQNLTESLSNEVAFDLPIEACAHCLSHSQPASGAVASVAVDPSKRLVETNSLPANLTVALPSDFSVPIAPSEHGPPGNSFPRYILINTFRI